MRAALVVSPAASWRGRERPFAYGGRTLRRHLPGAGHPPGRLSHPRAAVVAYGQRGMCIHLLKRRDGAMRPALACLSIGSSPPPWTAALLPLDWRLVAYPLLALLVCFAVSALTLRSVPDEARSKMKPWLIAASALLFIAVCSATFGVIALGDRWSDMLLQWSSQVTSRPGFLECQYAEVDTKFTQAVSNSSIPLWIYLGAMFLASVPWSRAMSIRNAALAERSPDIPGVPDDLAARRAIPYRPYRRRGFRRRWR
jgi:hypothetical protein